MAINKNHEFEDLDNIKCSIVEKNATATRVAFLKDLLTYNKYEVVVTPSPAPKAAAAAPTTDAAPATDTTSAPVEEPVAPSTFTIGVTDLKFNPTNAVFGRSLCTKEGRIVTLAYWQQLDTVSDDSVPYFDHI